MAIDINNLPIGEIPPEIAQAFGNFLNVEGRIKFPLKKTATSAVSTSAETPDSDALQADKDVDGLINSVDELEDLVEQLEDMSDQLTRDMNIPVDPNNKGLLKAVQRLGGENSITMEVFNTASAIIEHAAIVTFRRDPILDALIGDGHVDGPWMECSQITAAASDLFKLRPGGGGSVPEEPVLPKNEEILDDFEDNLLEMILHIILMLWWNMIWPKFLVDLAIINPARKIVAIPIDSLLLLFRSIEWKDKHYRIFKKKPTELLTGTPENKYKDAKGPLNKLLNRLRGILLCNVPPKLWNKKDYDPIVEIDCTDVEDGCPKSKQVEEGEGPAGLASDDNGIDAGGPGIDVLADDLCITSDDFIEGVDTTVPEGLGMSPECLKAASRVILAVEDTSYSAKQANANDPTLQTNLGVQVRENFGV